MNVLGQHQSNARGAAGEQTSKPSGLRRSIGARVDAGCWVSYRPVSQSRGLSCGVTSQFPKRLPDSRRRRQPLIVDAGGGRLGLGSCWNLRATTYPSRGPTPIASCLFAFDSRSWATSCASGKCLQYLHLKRGCDLRTCVLVDFAGHNVLS